MSGQGVGAEVGRLRVAGGADVVAIARLLRQGGVAGSLVDEVGVRTLGVNALGAAVREAAESGGGAQALRRHLEPLLRTGDLELARTACTSVVVVELDDEVIAVAVAAPARSLVEHVAARVDERARRGVLNRGVRTVAELCTVAVAAEHRRRGTGTRLVAEVGALYASAGYLRVIGQVPDHPSMTAFASAADLVVRPPRAVLDLTPVLGVPTVARPAARHRLVHFRGP